MAAGPMTPGVGIVHVHTDYSHDGKDSGRAVARRGARARHLLHRAHRSRGRSLGGAVRGAGSALPRGLGWAGHDHSRTRVSLRRLSRTAPAGAGPLAPDRSGHARAVCRPGRLRRPDSRSRPTRGSFTTGCRTASRRRSTRSRSGTRRTTPATSRIRRPCGCSRASAPGGPRWSARLGSTSTTPGTTAAPGWCCSIPARTDPLAELKAGRFVNRGSTMEFPARKPFGPLGLAALTGLRAGLDVVNFVHERGRARAPSGRMSADAIAQRSRWSCRPTTGPTG